MINQLHRSWKNLAGRIFLLIGFPGKRGYIGRIHTTSYHIYTHRKCIQAWYPEMWEQWMDYHSPGCEGRQDSASSEKFCPVLRESRTQTSSFSYRIRYWSCPQTSGWFFQEEILPGCQTHWWCLCCWPDYWSGCCLNPVTVIDPCLQVIYNLLQVVGWSYLRLTVNSHKFSL